MSVFGNVTFVTFVTFFHNSRGQGLFTFPHHHTYKNRKTSTFVSLTAEAIGQVTLEDDEVQHLTELIRTHHGETDVEALGLKEHYPTIYQKLEAAYRHTASLAEYKVDTLLGLYLDVWDTPTALIDQCLAELGYDAPNRHFDQLLSHLESLPLEDFAQFTTHHFALSFEDKPADSYDVEIPQGIIEEV